MPVTLKATKTSPDEQQKLKQQSYTEAMRYAGNAKETLQKARKKRRLIGFYTQRIGKIGDKTLKYLVYEIISKIFVAIQKSFLLLRFHKQKESLCTFFTPPTYPATLIR